MVPFTDLVTQQPVNSSLAVPEGLYIIAEIFSRGGFPSLVGTGEDLNPAMVIPRALLD